MLLLALAARRPGVRHTITRYAPDSHRGDRRRSRRAMRSFFVTRLDGSRRTTRMRCGRSRTSMSRYRRSWPRWSDTRFMPGARSGDRRCSSSSSAIFGFFFFYKLRIVPEHFWAARRFLPGDPARDAAARRRRGGRRRRQRAGGRGSSVRCLAGCFLRFSARSTSAPAHRWSGTSSTPG